MSAGLLSAILRTHLFLSKLPKCRNSITVYPLWATMAVGAAVFSTRVVHFLGFDNVRCQSAPALLAAGNIWHSCSAQLCSSAINSNACAGHCHLWCPAWPACKRFSLQAKLL
jgi:hypothetical protein